MFAMRVYSGGKEDVPFTDLKTEHENLNLTVTESVLNNSQSIPAEANFSAESNNPLLQYSPANLVHCQTRHCPSSRTSSTASGFGSREPPKSMVIISWFKWISIDREGGPGEGVRSMSMSIESSIFATTFNDVCGDGEAVWRRHSHVTVNLSAEVPLPCPDV